MSADSTEDVVAVIVAQVLKLPGEQQAEALALVVRTWFGKAIRA